METVYYIITIVFDRKKNVKAIILNLKLYFLTFPYPWENHFEVNVKVLLYLALNLLFSYKKIVFFDSN